MRKLLVVFLMLMYGFSSSGMTINLHYCCGKLDDISFSGSSAEECAMGGHLKKSGCCTNAQISANINIDQQTGVKSVSTQSSIAIPLAEPSYILFTNYVITVNRLARGAPDPSLSVPLFIRNRSFRI